MTLNLNTWNKPRSHQEIKRKICKRLIKDWQPNDRLPPIKELARHLGVGQSSTHQAVKELVREGILVSRHKMGTFVSNDLDSLKSKMKTVLDENETTPPPTLLANKKIQVITYRGTVENRMFFTVAIDSFTSFLKGVGCEVTTTLTTDAYPGNVPIDPQAHGVAVFNPSRVFPIHCLPSQILTVINSSSEYVVAKGERYDLIAADDIHGSLLAGNYLRERGWDDVCFLGVPNLVDKSHYDNISAKRLSGFTLGLGKPIRPEWLLRCDVYTSFYGAYVVKEWSSLNPRPSAIYAASDDLAYGFIHGALGLGLIPGRDYQIIGFDAQGKGEFFEDLALTSVAIPVSEMGIVAARMLIKRLEQPDAPPQRTYLGCQLFEGNTVAEKVCK
jgi:DNA-binding LacI/PurR family transcriptional regulator/DNA-binding transcriptional regulator YhcF (GntR family)